ncbi:MAG: NADH-quinone oxidoreductase subunit NuoE [Smithellaceae bacterium]|jgi:NADH-quinone oxidoreductase subunit E
MKKATTTIEAKTKEIIKKYSRDKSSVIAVLQDIQEQYNYLPKDALRIVNEEMEIPASRIYEVATFYNSFSLTPRGEHVIKLCQGTACHVRGAAAILDKLERTLGINPGETSSDQKFTLETVNCVGACALGPVMVVDGEYHGQVNMAKVDKIIGPLKKGTQVS